MYVKFLYMRIESFCQCIFHYELISLYKLFPFYMMTYIVGGMMNDERKASVLNTVSMSYFNILIVGTVETV
jgi:hypothetical protein